MTTYFTYDPLNGSLLMESDENGNTIATYNNEPDGRPISQTRNGVNSTYHYDGMDNVVALTDDNGDVTDTYEYSAFGEVISKTGNTVNPFGFKGALGYYANPGSDELYVRERTYQPSIGRWLSEDVLDQMDGQSAYLYFGNHPTGIGHELEAMYRGGDSSNLYAGKNSAAYDEANGMSAWFSVSGRRPFAGSPYDFSMYFGRTRCGIDSGSFPDQYAGVICNKGEFEPYLGGIRLVNRCLRECLEVHEREHIHQYELLCPNVCKDCPDMIGEVVRFGTEPPQSLFECIAYAAELNCLIWKSFSIPILGIDNTTGCNRNDVLARMVTVRRTLRNLRCPRPIPIRTPASA